MRLGYNIGERKAKEQKEIVCFGMVLWEIASKMQSFCDITKGDFPDCTEELPDIPTDCPEAYKRLIKLCWEKDVDKRITAQEILQAIETNISSATSNFLPPVHRSIANITRNSTNSFTPVFRRSWLSSTTVSRYEGSFFLLLFLLRNKSDGILISAHRGGTQ